MRALTQRVTRIVAGDDVDIDVAWQVDQRTGALVVVEDEILGLNGTQVGLLAGGGRLFVLGASLA